MQLNRIAPSTRRLRELLLQWGPYAGPAGDSNDATEDDDGMQEEANNSSSSKYEAEATTPRSSDGYNDDATASSSNNNNNRGVIDLGDGEVLGMSQYASAVGDDHYGRTQQVGHTDNLSLNVDNGDDDDANEGERQLEEGGAGVGAKRPASQSGIVASAAAASKRLRRGDGSGSRTQGYTYDQLLSYCPMSEQEMRAGLVSLGAMRIQIDSGDGIYRMLDESYAQSVLDAALIEASAQGQSLEAIEPLAIAASLSYKYPPFVTEHVLRLFSTGGVALVDGADGVSSSRSGSSPAATVCLDFKKVAAAKGLSLLRARLPPSMVGNGSLSASGVYPPSDGWTGAEGLLRAWAAAMPPGTVTSVEHSHATGETAAASAGDASGSGSDSASNGVLSLSLLAGHLLRETHPSSGVVLVRYYSHVHMPDEPAARFKELFQARQRWTEGE